MNLSTHYLYPCLRGDHGRKIGGGGGGGGGGGVADEGDEILVRLYFQSENVYKWQIICDYLATHPK